MVLHMFAGSTALVWPRMRMPPAARGLCMRMPVAEHRLWSPSDLTLYAESPWASWLERLAREHPAHPLAKKVDPPDDFLQMLGRKGAESEAAVLRSLQDRCGDAIVDLSALRGPPEDRVAATRAAIAEGPPVVYQAPLMGGGFFGVADFLVRIDDGREGAPARYMIWDAKLGREPRPSQALQLCCYAEMLAEQQGAPVERVGLVLGATPLVLRVTSFDALYRRTRARFLAAQAAFDPNDELPPPPGAPRPHTRVWDPPLAPLRRVGGLLHATSRARPVRRPIRRCWAVEWPCRCSSGGAG